LTVKAVGKKADLQPVDDEAHQWVEDMEGDENDLCNQDECRENGGDEVEGRDSSIFMLVISSYG
jgi:hypothetical protein